MLGKLEGNRRRECQRMRWFDSTTVFFFFFSFLKFIYFNWRQITLQCCMECDPILNPSPTSLSSHSSGSSQCTSLEHPVSCIEPGLVILFTYDNIHVSMPFSQIIPPSPSPTESRTRKHHCLDRHEFDQTL